MDKVTPILQLFKIKIGLMVSFTVFLGYFLKKPAFEMNLLLAVTGVLFLSSAASFLNNYLDRFVDRKMNRTKNRSLIIETISNKLIIVTVFLLLFFGLSCLFYIDYTIALLGSFAFVWYNYFYTPLKRITMFSVVPGSIIGSIPPIIGWISAGGKIYDPQAIILAFFFFIWQIPHFWYLLFYYSEDYSNAGLPVPEKYLPGEKFIRINNIWLFSVIISTLAFPLFRLIETDIMKLFLLFLVIGFSYYFFYLSKIQDLKLVAITGFKKINYFVLTIILLLSIDKILIK